MLLAGVADHLQQMWPTTYTYLQQRTYDKNLLERFGFGMPF